MQISLRVLRYVLSAADAGNLTEAARNLNISQPSVSAAIADLESTLGVQLFVRHHARGVTLTPAGARIVSEARYLMNHVRDFEKSARAFGSEVSGEIAVGCFINLANRYLPPLLSQFSKTHPSVEVNLFESSHMEVIEALRSGRIELALCYDYAVPEDFVGLGLARLAPHALLPADHRFAGEPEIALARLAREPYILLDLDHSREYFLDLFKEAGCEPRIGFRTRSYELIRGLVANGFGYSIHNSIARTQQTYDGKEIVAIRLKDALTPVQIMCFHLENHSLRPSVRAFSDFLRGFFRSREFAT